ncbi:MAG: hypothetical protein IIA45_08960, partial [Bacteroidetes bacterium]|nr:hypothetical protein [Bacteroidota bacterium]
MRYVTESRKIRYQEALPLFKKMRNGHPAFILESSDASEKYGRLSMVGFEPILELRGKDDQCTLKLLHKRGKPFLNSAKNAFRKYHSKTKGNSLTLTIPKAAFSGEEDDRLKRINIAQIIRRLLNEYHIEEKNFMGFYGALSYNFIYLFEDIATSKQNEELDFHLFLYDNIMLFNHLTRDCSIYCTRTNKQQAKRDVISQLKRINSKAVFKIRENSLKITDLRIQPSEKEYKQQVLRAKELCKNGELMELVLSRKLSAT